jgi:hypothetical protein
MPTSWSARLAAQTILHRADVEALMKHRRNRPLFLIDISVPRNIDPDVQRIDGVYLYNIDDLEAIVRATCDRASRSWRCATRSSNTGDGVDDANLTSKRSGCMALAFNLSLSGYLTALLFSAANLFSPNGWFASPRRCSSRQGVAQTVYMILRWFAAGRAPFSNMFESMVLFAWAIVVVYLALRIRHEIPVLGAATALLAVVTLAYASTFETNIQPLMPALRSNWLTVPRVHAFPGLRGVRGAALRQAFAI